MTTQFNNIRVQRTSNGYKVSAWVFNDAVNQTLTAYIASNDFVIAKFEMDEDDDRHIEAKVDLAMALLDQNDLHNWMTKDIIIK
jgi:hypothetical protein